MGRTPTTERLTVFGTLIAIGLATFAAFSFIGFAMMLGSLASGAGEKLTRRD